MSVISVVDKYFKELYRARVTFVLLFVFPFFFLFIFNMAFGAADIGTPVSYNLGITNLDEGIPEESYPYLPADLQEVNSFGDNLTEILSLTTYNTTEEQKIFDTRDVTQEASEQLLEDREIDLVLVIPANFSDTILTKINIYYGDQEKPTFPVDSNSSIQIMGTDDNPRFGTASLILESIIGSYISAFEEGISPDKIMFEVQSVQQIETPSIFDIITPGIFVFASIVAASLFASILLLDWDSGSIRRIKLSPLSTWQYLVGYLLITFFAMQLQIIFLFVAARIFYNYTPVGSYWEGYVILTLTSVGTYGLIFLASAFLKGSDEAGNFLGFSSAILGFASNAFAEVPDVVLIRNLLPFTSGSSHLLVWDLIPWTHAVNALRGVFIYGRTLDDVLGDFILLFALSVLWLGVGMFFFIRRKFAMEDF